MKKILIVLAIALTFMSCTTSVTDEPSKPLEIYQLKGEWTFNDGKIQPFFIDSNNFISHTIIFGDNKYFVEYGVTSTDTSHVYGEWTILNDTLTVIKAVSTDTVFYPVKLIGHYLKIGNAKYTDSIAYSDFIIGSWYQIGSEDQSFYQFNNDGTMIHYYRPVTPTVTDYYTWNITDNILSILKNDMPVDSTETFDIEVINEKYGKWNNAVFVKSH